MPRHYYSFHNANSCSSVLKVYYN